MKILTNVDISGSLGLGSSAKDTFTIGSQLENTDVNADNLVVYANADFKNNVILGSSSADTITANAAVSASAGVSASYFIGDGSGLYNLPNGGGNGGNNINVQTSGSGQNIVADYNNGTLTFRSLVAGDNVYFNSNGSEIQINANTSGGGQQNNSLNVQATGSGVSVFASHESGTLTLRSVKAGDGISVQEQSGDILVSADSSGWQSYNPEWFVQSGTPTSIGNGTLTGYYKQIGKTVFVRLRFYAGSTTTFGQANQPWCFSLPVSASSTHAVHLACTISDSSTNAWYEGVANNSFSLATGHVTVVSNFNIVKNSHPFTWAMFDSLQFNGSYEAA